MPKCQLKRLNKKNAEQTKILFIYNNEIVDVDLMKCLLNMQPQLKIFNNHIEIFFIYFLFCGL